MILAMDLLVGSGMPQAVRPWFGDDGYILPGLISREHVIVARTRRPGFLLDLPAVTLQDQREERRRTIKERCEKVAELVAHDQQAIAWGF